MDPRIREAFLAGWRYGVWLYAVNKDGRLLVGVMEREYKEVADKGPEESEVQVWCEIHEDNEHSADIVSSLRLYLTHAAPPGSFLQAILSNDLTAACANADDKSRHRIYDIVRWLYNNAPIGSYGTVENVRDWTAMTDEQRADMMSAFPEPKLTL